MQNLASLKEDVLTIVNILLKKVGAGENNFFCDIIQNLLLRFNVVETYYNYAKENEKLVWIEYPEDVHSPTAV